MQLLGHAGQLACACGAQEAAARGEAAALRAEVADLSRLVEAGTGLSAGEETARDELLRQGDAQARAALRAAASCTGRTRVHPQHEAEVPALFWLPHAQDGHASILSTKLKCQCYSGRAQVACVKWSLCVAVITQADTYASSVCPEGRQQHRHLQLDCDT